MTISKPIQSPPCPPRPSSLPSLSIRAGCVAVAALLGVVSVSACGVGASSGARGELAQDQRLRASCDPDAPPAADIQLDGTGSSASAQITQQRMAAVRDLVRTTAVCEGRLRVSVFSSSSAATTSLYDGALQLAGATTNARLKRVPRLVDQVMTTVRTRYTPAAASLDGGGSDITAQYRLAAEWLGQLGGKHHLRLVLLTDGFQNVGSARLSAKTLAQAGPQALASRVAVPRLSGAEIIVAGLGRVAGKPPSSATTEGLVAFYDALCHKAGAARCVSVTDYSTAGR